MIRLPWVARSAYEAVREERDRLRERNDALTDELARIARRKSGLPERRPAEKKERQPMPRELRELISGFENDFVRKELREEARRLYRLRGDWQSVTREVKRQMGEVAGEARGG